MNNFLNGMFGPIAENSCKLSIDGKIAIRTSDGSYKSYDNATGRLVNCDNMVFDIGANFFYVIPTNKVNVGDIIVINGKPKFVKQIVDDNEIKVINFDGSTIETVVPERHMFMGNTYFYGKIVSMFGQDLFKGGKGANKIMKFMMMSQMFNGNGNGNGMNMQNPMMMMMLMNGGNGDMFDGMFDLDVTDEGDN